MSSGLIKKAPGEVYGIIFVDLTWMVLIFGLFFTSHRHNMDSAYLISHRVNMNGAYIRTLHFFYTLLA